MAVEGDGVGMMEDANRVPIQWVPLSLTFVEYPAGDFLGYILAWFSLLPIFIGIGFVTLIIIRRDLHTISYFFGILLNEIINWILKHLIRDLRPTDRSGLLTEYGMPSSHSQYMWFFTTYLVLFLLIRVYQNYNLVDDLWKYITSVLGFLVSVVVCISRVYLVYHTFGQVLCGAIIGILLGASWFCTVHFLLTPFFPFISSSLIGEFFMVRDSTLIPHVLWFEYKSSRSEARSRQRKVTTRKSQ